MKDKTKAAMIAMIMAGAVILANIVIWGGLIFLACIIAKKVFGL